METVKTLGARKIEGAGNLKGFVDVRIGSIVVRGCSVFGTKGGELTASLPRRLSRDGRWADVIEIQDEALADAVRAAILEAYNEEKVEN